MVAIPQITRDRLASSVVGTPGVDTSGQKISESLAGAAADVGKAIGEYTVQRQESLDITEKNKISVDYKMKTLQDLEDIKVRYANDPEGAADAFMQVKNKNLEEAQRQSSNPRVALMVGQGDPYFDSHLIMNQQAWAYKQRNDLNVANIQNQANQIASQAEDIGRKSPSFVQMMEDIKPLANATGNLIASTSKVVSPESAKKLQERMLPTLYSRAFYGSLQDNPSRAFALTENEDVKKAFALNPKELDQMRQQALHRVEGMGKEEEWKQVIQPLIDSPEIVHQVATGEVDWNKIRSFPDSPLKDQLEKMALAGPSVNQMEKDEAVAQFFADAHDMGMQYKYGAGAGKSVSDLINFQTKLVAARNDNMLTQATFQTMYNKLAVPLRDAVLKAHDPETLKKVKGNGFFGMFQHNEEPDAIVDKYVGGYNTINNWMKSQGQDQDWTAKSAAIKKYMELSDSTKAEDRDFYGRPWTPQNLARKAMGIGDGDTLHTVFGPKVITGATPDGMPKFELTQEEMDKLNHMKMVSTK